MLELGTRLKNGQASISDKDSGDLLHKRSDCWLDTGLR
jgi:hypothetical protein